MYVFHSNFATYIVGQRYQLCEFLGYLDQLLSVKPSMLFFIQTLPGILCAGTISHVSFLDLFEPIAGATNPITWHFYGKLHV